MSSLSNPTYYFSSRAWGKYNEYNLLYYNDSPTQNAESVGDLYGKHSVSHCAGNEIPFLHLYLPEQKE